jgi:hypothetical protein
MRRKQFLTQKGYQLLDSAEHHKVNDGQLFQWLMRDILPKLSQQSSWPFVLLILQLVIYVMILSKPKDTRRCIVHLLVSTNFYKFLGLDQSTEILMYGDHPAMGDLKKLIPGYRNLTLFMPLRRQDKQWKPIQDRKMSYCDFAPTIMDILKFDYSPHFPFGKSLFGLKKGDVPS